MKIFLMAIVHNNRLVLQKLHKVYKKSTLRWSKNKFKIQKIRNHVKQRGSKFIRARGSLSIIAMGGD